MKKVKCLLVVLFMSACIAVSAAVKLKNAVIVHPDKPGKLEKIAVKDMKTALEKITGTRYRVVPEKNAPASGVKIYIGNTRAAAQAGIKTGKMEPQQFKMRAKDGKVFLVGGSPTGTSYAVITFLQTKFGVYSLAGDCRIFPKNANPEVKEFEKLQKPDVTDRRVYSLLDRVFERPEPQKQWIEFHRLNRMYWVGEDRTTPLARFSDIIPRMHSFYKLVPPKKYFKDHPEYYSLRKNGQRDWRARGNLCLSNKEVWQVSLKELLAAIKKERRANRKNPPTVYGVSPEDNPNDLCGCAPCKALAKKSGSFLSLIVDYANFLAREVRKVYPDVWLAVSINRNTDTPNIDFEFEKNILFIYPDRTAHSNSMYPLTHPMNHAGYKNLMAWRKKSPVLGLWDYFWCPRTTQPMVAVDAIIEDCRLFSKLKLHWMFKETEFLFYRSNFLSFHLLQVFLEMQLLFDASQDAEKLISDFMDGYYGPAAPEMKQYLAMLRKAQKEKPTSVKEWGMRDHRNFAHVTYDFLITARQLIKKAQDKVKHNKTYLPRVSWELLTVTNSLFNYVRFVPERKTEYEQYKKEYQEAFKLNMEVLKLRAPLAKRVRENFEHEFSADNIKFKDLPPELAKLPGSSCIAVQSKYLKGHAPAFSVGAIDPDSTQPRVIVKRFHSKKVVKAFPVTAGVYCPRTRKKTAIRITRAPADEKYHWYRIGTISLDAGAYIHVQWSSKLLLKDFYTRSEKPGKDLNRYEVWVSIKMAGPAYVPGSVKENGIYIDRGLLVRKP